MHSRFRTPFFIALVKVAVCRNHSTECGHYSLFMPEKIEHLMLFVFLVMVQKIAVIFLPS